MDHKKSPVRRKRQSKVIEENFWDCSVCTYRNSAEAFKCRMCDVRKAKVIKKAAFVGGGKKVQQKQNHMSTSTRKPRLNSALVAQQAATLPGASGTCQTAINLHRLTPQ
ncbi:hypothetical protein DOY81_011011 [Sarcophaga bullata]|nr:hypothetical protein DOY81_011011 [Sarcophaga bullata]